MALHCSFTVPLECGIRILCDSPTFRIHIGEGVFAIRISLFRSLAEPGYGGHIIAGNTLPIQIDGSQINLRSRITGRSFIQPSQPFLGILGNTVTPDIHFSEHRFRSVIAMRCRAQVERKLVLNHDGSFFSFTAALKLNARMCPWLGLCNLINDRTACGVSQAQQHISDAQAGTISWSIADDVSNQASDSVWL